MVKPYLPAFLLSLASFIASKIYYYDQFRESIKFTFQSVIQDITLYILTSLALSQVI